MTVSLTVAVGAPEPLTTGASQVEINPLAQYIAITTGGTGGEELVKIAYPELPEDGWANNGITGRRVVVFLKEKTNPADVVKFVNPDDGSDFNAYKTVTLQNALSEVTLTYVGAGVAFIWVTDAWQIDGDLTDGNMNAVTTYGDVGFYAPGVANTTDAGMALTLSGGAIDNAGSSQKAGDVALFGGSAQFGSAGQGGNVVLHPGLGGDGSYANIILRNLPTIDPNVSGALWNNSGVLTLSGG